MTAQVMIYVYHNRKKKYYGTGVKVKPRNWSAANEKVIGLPQHFKDSYNSIIQTQKITYLEKLAEGVPADEMKNTEPASNDDKSFLAFLTLYISELHQNLHPIRPSTAKSYQSALTRLKQYTRQRKLSDISFAQINMDWYRDYHSWTSEMQLGRSAFDNHIKIVKKIMRVAQDRELHNNVAYLHSEFSRKRGAKSDKIFLTVDEIKKIENLDLSEMPYLEPERDRFLISYYFIMRWEDSTKIRKEAIVENEGLHYTYRSGKSKVECTVPISNAAKALMEKRDYNFRYDSNQKANFKIKQIGLLAGITQLVQEGDVKNSKFSFITTHTARRSAATNLYLEGVDLETIARLGGWKKLETLRVYLRQSGMDVSKKAQNLNFFK